MVSYHGCAITTRSCISYTAMPMQWRIRKLFGIVHNLLAFDSYVERDNTARDGLTQNKLGLRSENPQIRR